MIRIYGHATDELMKFVIARASKVRREYSAPGPCAYLLMVLI